MTATRWIGGNDVAKRRRGPTPPRRWDPMRHSVSFFTGSPEQKARRDALIAKMGDTYQEPEVWGNSIYSAFITRDDAGNVRHISYHRRDRKAARDWRDTQRLKNDIAGAECEAIELYPAQSRVLDTANEYHLFVFPPGVILPFGWNAQQIAEAEADIAEAGDIGGTQRPFDQEIHREEQHHGNT